MLFFAVKYRRRRADDRPAEIDGSLVLELIWSIIPFLITVVMFVWATALFFAQVRVPDDAIQIDVVGKRWMWKLQHMTGQREINELHVPVGKPVRLHLTSEDVIHSFYVPAFRMKKDAVPGTLQRDLVPGHQARQVPHLLRRVLRHPALQDDRLGPRDGARRLSAVAGRGVRPRFPPWPPGRSSSPSATA